MSYSEVDEDYHLCPLPRYKLTSKSGTNKTSRAFIERPVSNCVIASFASKLFTQRIRTDGFHTSRILAAMCRLNHRLDSPVEVKHFVFLGRDIRCDDMEKIPLPKSCQ